MHSSEDRINCEWLLVVGMAGVMVAAVAAKMMFTSIVREGIWRGQLVSNYNRELQTQMDAALLVFVGIWAILPLAMYAVWCVTQLVMSTNSRHSSREKSY